MPKKKIIRPWLPVHKPFETGRVSKRWEGYKTSKWREFSIWFKTQNPICIVDGCNRETYYTDHVVPVRKLVMLNRNPFDQDECQPLCRMHGDKKSGTEGDNKKRGGGV